MELTIQIEGIIKVYACCLNVAVNKEFAEIIESLSPNFTIDKFIKSKMKDLPFKLYK